MIKIIPEMLVTTTTTIINKAKIKFIYILFAIISVIVCEHC